MDEEDEKRLEAGLRNMSLEEGPLEDSRASEILLDPSRFYNLQVGYPGFIGIVPAVPLDISRFFFQRLLQHIGFV
jgi:hypothetical protein